MNRIHLIIYVIFFTLISCKSINQNNSSNETIQTVDSLTKTEIYQIIESKSEPTGNEIDYSPSAEFALKLIRKDLISDNVFEFIVYIESMHNGIYTSFTHIKKIENGIKVNTNVNNAGGKISNSESIYSTKELIDKLDNLISSADSELVLAGTYQRIHIIDKNQDSVFYTRKAFGLINLMK